MAVGVEHPVVADYLHRLDAAAASLPAGRRAELVAEIRAHVAEALAATGRDDETAVREVLDRLGEPEDIVAAELEATAPGAGPYAGGAGPAWGTPPSWGGAPGEPPTWQPGTWQGGPAGPPRSPWGAVEVIAVLGLSLGTVLIPVAGTVAGLVCLWISQQWTRREKIVATVWSVLAPIALVVGGIAFLGASQQSSSSDSGVAPAPVVVSEVASPAMSDPASDPAASGPVPSPSVSP